MNANKIIIESASTKTGKLISLSIAIGDVIDIYWSVSLDLKRQSPDQNFLDVLDEIDDQ